MMFEVKDDVWEALDRKEGVRSGAYERVDCIVLTPDGEEHRVTTYNVCEDRREPFVKPTPEYVALVREAREHLGLDTAMLMAVSEGETPRLAIDAVFVYGTLMRGECRFGALRDAGLECVLLADARGLLFDLGSYPALVVSPDDSTAVQGEFMRLSDPEATLRRLDDIEGFDDYSTPECLYRRSLIDVHIGEGRIRRAWTYRMPLESVAGRLIESGDWREHNHRKEAFLEKLAAEHAQGNEQRLLARLANRPPFSFESDPSVAVAEISSVYKALTCQLISERMLAQESGRWVVAP